MGAGTAYVSVLRGEARRKHMTGGVTGRVSSLRGVVQGRAVRARMRGVGEGRVGKGGREGHVSGPYDGAAPHVIYAGGVGSVSVAGVGYGHLSLLEPRIAQALGNLPIQIHKPVAGS